MLRSIALAGAVAAIVVPAGAQTTSFDGKWTVHQDCPASGTTRAYKVDFPATIAGGTVHGEYGKTDIHYGNWTVTGQIRPDGHAILIVRGMTGNPDRSVRNATQGTRFDYPISGRFEGKRGSLMRTLERTCTFTFTKD